MSKDFLADRRQTLEEKFFHQREARLLERMREEREREEAREGLAAATGIKDLTVVDELVALGFKVETLVATTMVPLVAVAWADQRLDPEERKAVLTTAEQSGMQTDSAAFELLQSWLEKPPPEDLLTAWVDYVTSLKSTLNSAAYATLRTDILSRARGVAEAAGGYFGMGKVSRAEQVVLDKIEAALS